ncbi:hypothetical protein BV25DRAFT_622658 [Artomyces pyxidatus]|uniref:Uncharacterized protein n=1 Tax=Artomyces pyxidatus TaxID=48021 RepID=A0ACB8T1Z1_9AGAM|nr:hypothetical protein BV25DRAFT_622658 [Artomyces pyxidatus]
MDHFSWSDTLRALASPCLACLRVAHPHPHLSDHDPYAQERQSLRLRTDDLEGLLADSGSSSADADAETLSLHSNLGSSERRRKKRHFPKHIRLFGWDLFGRPPIQLPDDEDERRERRRGRMGTLSSSTLDSDAAPLDASVIQSRVTEQLASYEDELERARLEQAERKAERRARKERRRAARALALQAGLGDDAAFEGFQGSGSPMGGPIPSPYLDGMTDSVDSGSVQTGQDEADEEAADFGGLAYARRPTSGSGSGNGSDSRSRTSASRSQAPATPGAEYNHHFLAQAQTQTPASAIPASLQPKKHRKSSSRSSKSSRSASSASASMSPSLPSPRAPHFPDLGGGVPVVSPPEQEFEGFPNDLGVITSGLGMEVNGAGGFPSPGLGGPRASGKRDMGAFLARRD